MTEYRPARPYRLFAPAKVNLGLEVTGKRADGFHDVVTVLESVSVFDVIDVWASDRPGLVSPSQADNGEDLVEGTLRALEAETGIRPMVRVRISKHIPLSAGLGGGSSDAGTILGAIARATDVREDVITEIAASLGSDVPFFLHGGLALASGTGTELEFLDTPGRRWYVIVVPEIAIPGKTGHLYRRLDEDDFSDGSVTRQVAETLRRGNSMHKLDLVNAFERPLLAFDPVQTTLTALRGNATGPVLPSGAGPACIAVFKTRQEAAKVARPLRAVWPTTLIATSVRRDINVRHW